MHLRTLPTALILGLLLTCVAGFACAQHIYTWKDANGVTHFSQSPPASGVHFTEMSVQGAPTVSSNPAPAAHTGAADAESQEQAPRKQAAAAGGTEPDTPDNRAKLCKQLDSNIALLAGKQPVVSAGTSGKQAVMSDNAREQQLATARAQQAQYCSAQGS